MSTSALDSLKPQHVCIEDVTDGHTKEGFEDGRSLTVDGRELLVMVVSSVFEGKQSIERHQLVHDCFRTELDSGKMHSIQIRAWTPTQWAKKGSPTTWPEKGTKYIPASEDHSPKNSGGL